MLHQVMNRPNPKADARCVRAYGNDKKEEAHNYAKKMQRRTSGRFWVESVTYSGGIREVW